MYTRYQPILIHCLTPVHPGRGSDVGIIDLPIQRERTTGYPIVQASGLKGCLRDESNHHRDWCQNVDCPLYPHKYWDRKIEIIFGPDTQRASDHAGAISIGDACILLFPVRSLSGVFAWVTSENVLARFKRDAEIAGFSDIPWRAIGPETEGEAFVAPDNEVTANGRIVLEEFAFTERKDEDVQMIANWLKENALPSSGEYEYWRESLPRRLVILPENAFRDFTLFSTEVISRIRLDKEKKTVARGALWSEEHLPSDTLLYAMLFASKPRVSEEELPEDWKETTDRAEEMVKFVRACVDGRRIQLGGDATVGRGFVKIRISGR